ncbi:MAG TPA: YaiO family outer membrane beta-barrel protein [Gemmatimonadaceae bacterium]|nr:YaiO family outer membrane beta-barrel protein [Gemmatimonadaceae bacterium]
MMRTAWMTRVAGVALAALAITAANAPAQGVRQQSVRPAYDVDSAMARATLLRRQNRKAEAERVMAQAVAMAPGRADARALHEQLRQEVRGGEAVIGVEYKKWREQLPEWREGVVSARQNAALGPVIARFSVVDRGPLRDDRLALEAYPAFHRGYLALAGAIATEGTVYAQSTASAELFASLTERLEGSVGYRRMNFDTGVDLIGGSLAAYAGQFMLGARGTRVLDGGGSSVVLSARRFFGDAGASVGAKVATGSVPVELRTPTDFTVRFSQSAALEVRAVVLRHLVLSAEGEAGRDGLSAGGSTEYRAARVGIGVRY